MLKKTICWTYESNIISTDGLQCKEQVWYIVLHQRCFSQDQSIRWRCFWCLKTITHWLLQDEISGSIAHNKDFLQMLCTIPLWKCVMAPVNTYPNSKVHGANMGPIWGRQDPGGPHVGPMNFAIWGKGCQIQWCNSITQLICFKIIQ